MAIIRKILILICFSVPSLAYGQLADTSYYPEMPEMDENYEIKNKKENSNYPSVDGFFAGKLANEQSHKGSFFNSKDLSSSNMFNSSSPVPSFDGVSNSIQIKEELEQNNKEEVKQYDAVIRYEDEENKGFAKGEEAELKDKEVPDTVKHLDSSIEMAVSESSSDPKIQSALKASMEIREAIFGKKAVVDKDKNKKTSSKTTKIEDSVRF